MSDKSDLKAELERKKQRLAQIREEKKRKEEERKKKEADLQQRKEPTQEDSDLDRKRRETEALLQSIGISPEPPLVPTPLSPSSKSASTPSEAGSQDSGDLGVLSSCLRTLQWDTDPSVLQLQTDADVGRRLHKLGVSKVTQVDFLPREVVSYCKETQTPLDTLQSEEDEEDEEMVEAKARQDSDLERPEEKQEVKEAPPRELTEEEKQQIVHSEEFLIFFDKTIRVIERALAEDSDIFFDYSGRELEDTDGPSVGPSVHQESMELVYNKSKAVAVTGMAFPTGDVNNFVVGSEEGTVYTACRHGSKAGIGEVFEGHQGPVTGISCHTAVGPVDFSHLFVTSSFDWTLKLWSTKHNRALYSFEDNADYVYDVMWSPAHPALFACVDGMGRLDLWDLNSDTEVPTASVAVEGASALNRVRWAHSGKEVAVGDSEGRIWVYDVGELAVPHNDEWSRLARTLVEIRANRADSEEEGGAELAA
ncbi:LOW QUALITY PROTEIN: cytoplasmic dynein 1 intermediate chain 1 [Monodelphis domestica]|uniref:LOW QUALITY PROTEIN: cytoplasmic dynein 1 intermediate chain 1 n=1 Tax=Monodelphis domestica TaxID=13616 RepID=UPI0024E24667|nr:LOW QUALITY PROTEIN: cytoplasmic dynein 1 intermediate chain 1 [Monodelphis domestica]